MQPTLLIGLGGTGAHVVAYTQERLLENPATAEKVGNTFQFLYIDAGAYNAEHTAKNLKLPEWGIVSIGGVAIDRVLEHNCQHDSNLKTWFDCERLAFALRFEPGYMFPGKYSLDLERWQYRQLGRLCLYDDLANGNFSKIRRSIHHSLTSIQQQTPDTPLIIICTSLIGGTGGAIALDMAYLVRDILATIRINPYDGHILGVFALSNVFASAFSQAPEEQHIKFILNEVAAIKEIQHFARTRYEFGPQGYVVTFDNLEPFNSYWLFGGDRTGKFQGKWPTDYFSLIATEISDTVVTGDWIMRPQGFEYVNIQAPLTTDVIGDWSYWEDIYNRHSKDINRLSPHISREFEKRGAG